MLSTSALCTNTALAFFNFSGLAKSSILSRVGASDDNDPNNGNSPGSIPSRVSSGANSITLSTRSIVPEDVSPPTLRIRCITPIDLLIASRSGSSFVSPPPSSFLVVDVVFVSSSHPPLLLPTRGGRLAVAISVQSPIIIRSSDDDDGGGAGEEGEEAKEAAGGRRRWRHDAVEVVASSALYCCFVTFILLPPLLAEPTVSMNAKEHYFCMVR